MALLLRPAPADSAKNSQRSGWGSHAGFPISDDDKECGLFLSVCYPLSYAIVLLLTASLLAVFLVAVAVILAVGIALGSVSGTAAALLTVCWLAVPVLAELGWTALRLRRAVARAKVLAVRIEESAVSQRVEKRRRG